MKNKIINSIIIMIMLLVLMTTVSNATFSYTATMEADKTTTSSEVSVTVKIANLEIEDNGISSFSATIQCDTDVFSEISQDDIEPLNNWKISSFDKSTGKVSLSKISGVTSDETVFTIALKVVDSPEKTEGKVELSNITASDGTNEQTAQSISTTIKIGDDGEDLTGNTENTTTENASIIANVQEEEENTVEPEEENTVITPYVNTVEETEDDIPYTGVEDGIPFVIIGVVLLAIVFYIRIERINKEMK